MPDQPTETPQTAIACPFCGLGCDDLSPSLSSERPRVDGRGCSIAEAAFGRALASPPAAPRVRGQEVSLEAALAEAARLIREARLPLYTGLCGDLADIRGALRLAERTGGALDHRNGDALTANMAVLEESGWIVTSLGETRNRADLLVLVGEELLSGFPRLEERLLHPAERLHTDAPITLVQVGPDAVPGPDNPLDIRVEPGRMRDFFGVLRARLTGRRLDVDPFPQAAVLAERLTAASYPVIAFAASALGAEPHPDLVVRSLAALVRELNQEGRAALLPLGGGDGEVTANQVSAWHTGFGARQRFHGGLPEYRPRDGSAKWLLSSGGADLLVWISTLSDRAPPATGAPTLVLGHPAMGFEQEPEVFVPLAVPGVHRAGAVHRGDGVALLPLSAIADSELPASAEVFARLLELVVEEE